MRDVKSEEGPEAGTHKPLEERIRQSTTTGTGNRTHAIPRHEHANHSGKQHEYGDHCSHESHQFIQQTQY